MNKRAIVFFTIFLTSFNVSANQNIPTIKDYLNDENKKYVPEAMYANKFIILKKIRNLVFQ